MEAIAQENRQADGTEQSDREFHLAIARATRNTAIFNAIEHLWDLRASSPEAALLHEKARSANIKPVVDEHTAVLTALWLVLNHVDTRARNYPLVRLKYALLLGLTGARFAGVGADVAQIGRAHV